MGGWIREGRGEDGRMEQGEGKWEGVPISIVSLSHSKFLQYYNTLM